MDPPATTVPFVRTPASSANLGAGFDVLGLALSMHADVGAGEPPAGAAALDEHHPARAAFSAFGGAGPLWLRSAIPMARGLGYSGAVRVGAAALGAALQDGGDPGSIRHRRADVLRVAVEHEGHGDNAAASLCGGVVAFVDGRVVEVRVGPTLAAAVVVTWIPDRTTSTDRSRRALAAHVERRDAVHNIGRALQLALAFEHDDPKLLGGATDDRLHQPDRLALVPGAAEAIAAGVGAGAWCGWLSGSGPTVALLCDEGVVDDVAQALPPHGHVKRLAIDTTGARLVGPPA